MKQKELKELKKKFKRSNKYMLCLSYEDIDKLFKLIDDFIKRSSIYLNPIISDEVIEVSSKTYANLVKTLAKKIEYHSRIIKALEYMDHLDSLDMEQFDYLEKILKGEL